MPRLREAYKEKVIPALANEFKYKNNCEIPKLEKIILSMGLGKGIMDKNYVEKAITEAIKITGQKPQICKAKKSVSNFKLREGMDIGLKVTLRRDRMYEFLDRLLNLAIPRVRDFRGLSEKGFDGRGNFNMGLTEVAVFPEATIDNLNHLFGMNITMVTSAKNDEQGRQLLTYFGMPFQTSDRN